MALALENGPPPVRFLVYLSALTLITSAALDRALLFVVDDAQWLDQQSMEALAVAARRILADPVALVFGLRTEEVSTGLDGLPVLALHGLSAESAHEMLAQHGLGAPQPRLRGGAPDRRGGRRQPAGDRRAGG